MGFRCYWCDSDQISGLTEAGEVKSLFEIYSSGNEPKDVVCDWCGHLLSEGNPRAGNPEETLDSVKQERDEIRAMYEAVVGERIEDGSKGVKGEPA